MRLVAATLTLSASLALGALAPAQAAEYTIHVPILHCDINLSHNDLFVSATPTKVTFERAGRNSFSQTCTESQP